MSEFRVLVSDKLSDKGLAVLQNAAGVDVDYKPGLSEDELAAAIGDYDGLVIRSGSKVTAKVLAAATRLKAVGRAGIGVDNIDLKAASQSGVVVMNTPHGNAVTTAEHAISLMLSLARNIPRAAAAAKSGEWAKSANKGVEIDGKTLGIVGLGNIGRIAANRAQGLHMKVIAADPVLDEATAAQLNVEKVSLDELFERADFVSVHAPLMPATRGLIGADQFAKAKKSLRLVNAARGGIVDEGALAAALTEGKIAGAAVDVFATEPFDASNPLLALDNCICTPHLGASTGEAQTRVAVQIAEQLVDYLNTGTIKNSVNVPSLGADAKAALEPYIEGGTWIGRMLGQLASGDVREVRVLGTGKVGEIGVGAVKGAVLSGFLERFADSETNPISAPYEAKERGINVVEANEASGRGYSSTLRASSTSDDGIHTVTMAVGARGEYRLIGLDGYEIDMVLERGTLIVMRNRDEPGVIGAVGTIIGERGVNVARMALGLDRDAKQAISVWSVDGDVSPSVVEQLASLSNVESVSRVRL